MLLYGNILFIFREKMTFLHEMFTTSKKFNLLCCWVDNPSTSVIHVYISLCKLFSGINIHEYLNQFYIFDNLTMIAMNLFHCNNKYTNYSIDKKCPNVFNLIITDFENVLTFFSFLTKSSPHFASKIHVWYFHFCLFTFLQYIKMFFVLFAMRYVLLFEKLY